MKDISFADHILAFRRVVPVYPNGWRDTGVLWIKSLNSVNMNEYTVL